MSYFGEITRVETNLKRLKIDMRRFRVTFFVLFVSIFVPSGLLYSGPFMDPHIPDGQTAFYRYETAEYPNKFLIDVKKGEEVVTSSSRVEIVHSQKGEKIYRIHDAGSRQNGYRFEHVSELLAEKELKPLGFVARDRNPEGRVIREMKAVFDDPTLCYPTGTFPVFCLAQAMRGTTFSDEDRIVFYLWIAPTEIFRMSLEVIKKEKIEVPAGEILCYAAEMKPDIRTILPIGNFLAKLLQPFIPKYRFWFACDQSHPMVKFEGILGGAGAAKHTIELTRLENKQVKGTESSNENPQPIDVIETNQRKKLSEG